MVTPGCSYLSLLSNYRYLHTNYRNLRLVNLMDTVRCHVLSSEEHEVYQLVRLGICCKIYECVNFHRSLITKVARLIDRGRSKPVKI